ncbi:MAG: hypothetical protein ACKOW2_04670 [Sphingobacteriaceae bacterium]
MNFKALLLMVYTGIIAGLIITSCNKSDLFNPEGSTEFREIGKNHVETLISLGGSVNQSVGAPLAGSTGRKWIKNFKSLNPGGRTDYFLMTSDLELILSKSNCVGICLCYAVNNKDELIILPLGVNKDGRIIKPETINTEEGLIDWTISRIWMANYKGQTLAHFFGTNTFYRLSKNPNCRIIRVSYAQDTQGNSQLLLADAADSDPWMYEADSKPFPPFYPGIN